MKRVRWSAVVSLSLHCVTLPSKSWHERGAVECSDVSFLALCDFTIKELARRECSGVSFLGSQLVDEERMRLVAEFSPVGVNALSFLQCFDTVGWMTG